MKGKCTKCDACDYWHPPVCRFFKSENCTAGKICSFLHPPAEGSATPAPKQEGNKNETKDANKKGKKGDNTDGQENKPQGRVFFRAHPNACFATIQSKTLRFRKFSQRKSARGEKNPTYLNGGPEGS